VARRASAVGVITINWQQIPLGRAAVGRNLDAWVTDEVIQVFDGDELLRTVLRKTPGEIRKKRASIRSDGVTNQPKLYSPTAS
jgi:hypothetical protein